VLKGQSKGVVPHQRRETSAQNASEEIKMSEELETNEEGNEEKKGESNWDAERQRLDQAESSVQALSDKLEAAEGDKALLLEKLDAIEAKLTEEAEDKGFNLESVDDDLVGPGVSKNFKLLQDQLDATRDQLKTLQTKASAYEEEKQESERSKRKDATIEKICTPLDKRFGAKFRKAAQDLANEKIKEGKEQKPQDALDARDLLTKCYKEVAEAAKPEKKEPTPTDTGIGGAPFKEPTGKKGALEDVYQDMLSNITIN